tara:strand:+ start:223 stop:417 length:195 start_codon:yes stop_codon:yes gene_type:complete
MFGLLSEAGVQDPLITKRILESLTPAQNKHLESGRLLINPITGDTIVPIRVSQNQIARIVINIY